MQRLKFAATVTMSNPPVLEALEFHALVRTCPLSRPCFCNQRMLFVIAHCQDKLDVHPVRQALRSWTVHSRQSHWAHAR